ncbi:MAG TPA: hypothetical protein VFS04_02660 [Alphaproteobacteria bacterium]|nr:hypothetical protein [Alphaproteobacteria bacterium]
MKYVVLKTIDDFDLVVFVEQLSCIKALSAETCELALTGGFSYMVKGGLNELLAKIND